MTRHCLWSSCGKPLDFQGESALFCSQKCKRKYSKAHKGKLLTPIRFSCAFCGEWVVVRKTSDIRRKFCSSACRASFRSKIHSEKARLRQEQRKLEESKRPPVPGEISPAAFERAVRFACDYAEDPFGVYDLKTCWERGCLSAGIEVPPPDIPAKVSDAYKFRSVPVVEDYLSSGLDPLSTEV